MATANYVRFLRGTPTAYTNLSLKDSDTLYFISEKNADHGSLYLGDKLIMGMNTGKISINQINEVLLSQGIDSGSLLVFDEDKGKWVNKTASEVFALIAEQMVGATADNDGKSGLVPVPKAGEQNLFLRGDGTWASPDNTDITELKATVSTLVGTDTDKSVRTIAIEALTSALIPNDAKESLNTLQEIADWIQDHPDDASDFNSRILALEGEVFDTINSEDGSVSKEGLVTTVGNLSLSLTQLGNKVTNLTTDVRDAEKNINTLFDRLKWHDMNDADGSATN